MARAQHDSRMPALQGRRHRKLHSLCEMRRVLTLDPPLWNCQAMLTASIGLQANAQSGRLDTGNRNAFILSGRCPANPHGTNNLLAFIED